MPTAIRQIVQIDTAANWTSANTTLQPGVTGLESDTGNFKMTGTATAWNSVSYVQTGLKMSHPQTMSRVSLGI